MIHVRSYQPLAGQGLQSGKAASTVPDVSLSISAAVTLITSVVFINTSYYSDGRQIQNYRINAMYIHCFHMTQYNLLHDVPCFQCNIVITNFFIAHACSITWHSCQWHSVWRNLGVQCLTLWALLKATIISQYSMILRKIPVGVLNRALI